MKQLQFIAVYGYVGKPVYETQIAGIDIEVAEKATALEILMAIRNKLAEIEHAKTHELCIHNLCKL